MAAPPGHRVPSPVLPKPQLLQVGGNGGIQPGRFGLLLTKPGRAAPSWGQRVRRPLAGGRRPHTGQG